MDDWRLSTGSVMDGIKAEEELWTAPTTAASSPLYGISSRRPAVDELLVKLLCDSTTRGDVNREIIKILTGSMKETPTTSADEEESAVRRTRTEKRPYGAAVVVDGSCQHCDTDSTPQWRYIHREKFCNACYMRMKRWVSSHLPGAKLPPRARMDLSADDDAYLTQQARHVITLALAGLGGSSPQQ